MTTAEFAETRAEQISEVGFPYWGAVRACALSLYVVALVAYTIAYGIPVQRELVIAWTCGALACASIGRPPREILQLVLDWLPIVAVLMVYDFTRGMADSMGIGVNVTPMIDFDRFVFFGETPTEWLQERLYDPGVVHWWDVAFTLVYTSYFIVPFAVAGVLWAREPAAFLQFTKRLVSLALAGLATYILFPAAPPWMAGEQGLIDVHRTTGKGWEVLDVEMAAMFSRSQGAVNLVAAVPSLHSAFVGPGGDVPLGPGPADLAAAARRLSAGDGLHPDGDRRALLLRRHPRLALRRRGDGRLGLVGTAEAAQGLRQRRLERVDRLDLERVDPAAPRPASARPGHRASPRRAGAPCATPPPSPPCTTSTAGGDNRLRGQLEAAAEPRVLLGVLEQDHREPGALGDPVQPAISLWSASGSSEKKAWSFAFSLTWVFQRRATGDGQLGTVDDGAGCPRGARRSPRRGPRSSATPASSSAAARLDLGRDPRPGAGERGDLGRGDEHVGDGRARLQDPRQADHRHPRHRAPARPARRRC